MNESCHTYEWVVSHIWTSHATHMDVSCHIYEWVMSHIWMSHVTHTNERVMSPWWTSHVTHMNESCRTYERAMPHKRRANLGGFPHVTWLFHTRDFVSDVTDLYVWHDSLVCVTNEACHTRERPQRPQITHSYSYMSHIWISHDPFILIRVTCMNESCHTYEWVLSHV